MNVFDQNLIGAREACDRLHVSRMTLLRMISAGQLRAYRLPSGVLRIALEDLDRVLTVVQTLEDSE